MCFYGTKKVEFGFAPNFATEKNSSNSLSLRVRC